MHSRLLAVLGVSLVGGVALMGCAVDTTPEAADDSSQALVIPPPEAPDTFPTPVACPSGTTCTFTPTALTLNLPCTNAEWFSESGAASTGYFVAFCAKGFATYAQQIPNWIAQHPGWQAAQSTTQLGLPTTNGTFVYLRFLPPTPTALPGLSSYPAGELTPDGVAHDADGVPESLPCSPKYLVNQSMVSTRQKAIMYCTATPDVLAWAAANAKDALEGQLCQLPGAHSIICGWTSGTPATAGMTLVPASFGYVYLAYDVTNDGGGGCPGGCAHL